MTSRAGEMWIAQRDDGVYFACEDDDDGLFGISIMTGDVIIIVSPEPFIVDGFYEPDALLALTRYGIMEIYDPVRAYDRWKRIA